MHIHFIGACGRAIGSLALELMRQGWRVTASDAGQWAPMDRVLRAGGLHIHPTFSARHLPRGTEIAVTGSLVGEDNPEIRAARRRGIPVMHMAAFLRSHLLPGRRRLVVAGTNGKTTTTTMLAWILERAGLRPDFLFGGLSPHFASSVRMSGEGPVVLEGDEYRAGSSDPLPKFRYYDPEILAITQIQFDHAEIYRDFQEIRSQFEALIEGIPDGGLLIIPDTCPTAFELAKKSRANVTIVGRSSRADCRLRRTRITSRGISFDLEGQRFRLPLYGEMSARNAAMAVRAAQAVGVSMEVAALAMEEYRPVRGRLEVLVDEPNAALVIDEGYHPAALRENIIAIRQRFPGRRLLLSLQPRYTGGRDGFQMKELPSVLSKADRVILNGHFDLMEFPGGAFSNARLATRIRDLGTPVHLLRRATGLRNALSRIWQPGDVLLSSLQPGCEFITDPLAAKIRALASHA